MPQSTPVLRALGLMSGTSLDGVDAALVETEGHTIAAIGAARTYPYSSSLRERLRRALGGRQPVKAVERDMTLAHAAAVSALLKEAGLTPAGVDVIGFHGQTLVHRPREGFTWQIGDGELLAQRTKIDVVGDFRSADVAAGGEGAPFVPIFHAALAAHLPRPLAVLNVGGVANVTWIGPQADTGAAGRGLLAFDTGPGNALIDDWMLARQGTACDAGGTAAAAGHVDLAALAALMSHVYFSRPPPKSLDRNAFDPAPVAGLSTQDGAATLTAFTAHSVAAAAPHFPAPPRAWIVTGGGRRNPTLIAMLRAALGAEVRTAEEHGWNGDALEAQAFAFLAVRSLRGLPLSFPSTTGVTRPMLGGRLFRKP
ncbi:MAG TPA: anhydro-N-acetylmuramic acid kinase [Alphaproteobacteria bacterium]|nr:anhydro-N-acetylmuramic acid kinase [Alphaproteobacteria bacterium]